MFGEGFSHLLDLAEGIFSGTIRRRGRAGVRDGDTRGPRFDLSVVRSRVVFVNRFEAFTPLEHDIDPAPHGVQRLAEFAQNRPEPVPSLARGTTHKSNPKGQANRGQPPNHRRHRFSRLGHRKRKVESTSCRRFNLAFPLRLGPPSGPRCSTPPVAATVATGPPRYTTRACRRWALR